METNAIWDIIEIVKSESGEWGGMQEWDLTVELAIKQLTAVEKRLVP